MILRLANCDSLILPVSTLLVPLHRLHRAMSVSYFLGGRLVRGVPFLPLARIPRCRGLAPRGLLLFLPVFGLVVPSGIVLC
jgi:hypothetical protein